MIDVTLVGSQRLQSKLNRLSSEGLKQAMGRAIVLTATDLHADLIRSLSLPGTGRLYKKRGVTHRASAPGRPPATDIGTYKGSIQPDLTRVLSNLIATIGPRGAGMQLRGKWLEYGTRGRVRSSRSVTARRARQLGFGSGRMAARPHFGPVALKGRALFSRKAHAEVDRVLKSPTGR